MKDETSVRFNLWAVLAFLCLLGGICFAYLFNVQTEARVTTTTHSERITKLETNYDFIIDKLNDIKISQDEVKKELVRYRSRDRDR